MCLAASPEALKGLEQRGGGPVQADTSGACGTQPAAVSPAGGLASQEDAVAATDSFEGSQPGAATPSPTPAPVVPTPTPITQNRQPDAIYDVDNPDAGRPTGGSAHMPTNTPAAVAEPKADIFARQPEKTDAEKEASRRPTRFRRQSYGPGQGSGRQHFRRGRNLWTGNRTTQAEPTSSPCDG